ncbi:MAG: SDR family oxidoreductase [Candidatus Protochlamydia sp.]|nr:SDR family oxidoreductase [Candidatus Protochlamydia sp.]
MNIVVTGASSGIGFEIAKALATKNHTVVAIARRGERLAHLEAECLKVNPSAKIFTVEYDLALLSETGNNLLEYITRLLPFVDILVNNAGLLKKAHFAELNLKDFSETFAVNVFAPAELSRLLLPLMGKRNAHIVNISSMGGFQGSSKFPGIAAYSSSKAALNCLTECLAVELAEVNIKVNCLALGAVRTEMLAKAFPHYKASVTAEQMGEYIAQFALNGHHYFNGKIIPVSLAP